ASSGATAIVPARSAPSSGCSRCRPTRTSATIPGGRTTSRKPGTPMRSSRNCGGRSGQGPPHDKDTEETKDTKDTKDVVSVRVRCRLFLCVLCSLGVLVACSHCVLVACSHCVLVAIATKLFLESRGRACRRAGDRERRWIGNPRAWPLRLRGARQRRSAAGRAGQLRADSVERHPRPRHE